MVGIRYPDFFGWELDNKTVCGGFMWFFAIAVFCLVEVNVLLFNGGV